MLQKLRRVTFCDCLLLAALVLTGGFHEYIACGLSVAMCVFLLLRLRKDKTLSLPKNAFFLAAAVISLGYGITALWAVDRGMALIGFVKFLPLPLYLLCLRAEGRASTALSWLPYLGAAMAVISAVGMAVPGLKDSFSVADRLAGFFQYPNTFALFLLVCQLLLLKKPGKKLPDYLTLTVLAAGLLYTGSRTVFAVAVLANIAMLFLAVRRKGRAVLLALGGAVCLAAVILAFSENSVIGRYLRFSLTESTLVGRVLYVVDALPLLVKYPFGMGYMGYYYIQGSVQTGLYSVMYIHNELLQLLLDIGWIPAVAVLVALGRWFFRKTVSAQDKLIVATVCLHSLFDFNLQFTGMALLLLLLTHTPCDKPRSRKVGAALPVALAAVACLSLYLGTSLGLAHFGAYRAADAMYPGNTRNKLTIMEQTEDLAEADRVADSFLRWNTHYFAPYIMKAQYAYSQGDFGSVIQYAEQGLAANPLQYQQYEDYCRMLLVGVQLYIKAGDNASAGTCAKALNSAVKQLESNGNRLSALGKMIADQPITTLPAELLEQVRKVGG